MSRLGALRRGNSELVADLVSRFRKFFETRNSGTRQKSSIVAYEGEPLRLTGSSSQRALDGLPVGQHPLPNPTVHLQVKTVLTPDCARIVGPPPQTDGWEEWSSYLGRASFYLPSTENASNTFPGNPPHCP
jgi:hypothetical protein